MGAYEVKKARAIALTVEGYTQKAIADALTVDTRTIRRWAKEPDFIAELKEERESALELAKAHRASMYLTDMEEGRASNQLLVKIRDNSNLEVKTRMRAAQLLMNQALKSAALMIKEEQANRTKADKTGHATVPQAASLPVVQASSAVAYSESGQNRTIADNSSCGTGRAVSARAAVEVGFHEPEPCEAEPRPTSEAASPVPQEAPENPDETGQKRTSYPRPAIEELREKALKNCEEHMQKLDHIDKLAEEVKIGLTKEGVAEIEKYQEDIEASRVNLDGMIESLETSSPEELRSLLEKTGGQLFDLKIEMPKFKPKAA